MTGTCKDCKWWKEREIVLWGMCSLAASSKGGWSLAPIESKAIAQKAGGGYPEDEPCVLFTRPDFACNQWEKKS